jgi:hypothetical protein
MSGVDRAIPSDDALPGGTHNNLIARAGIVLGGDISAFLGTEAKLRFESEHEGALLDAIRFVPGPSALGLVLVGLAAATGCRRRLTLPRR